MKQEKIDFRNPAMLLTLWRMVSALITCVFLFTGILSTPTFVMKIGESLSDFLDGFIARHFGYESFWGKTLDPPADKMSNGSSLVFIALGNLGFLPYLNMPFPEMRTDFLWILLSLETLLFVSGYVLVRQGFDIKPNRAGKCKMFCECVFINLYFLSYLAPWGYRPDPVWTSRIANSILLLAICMALGSIGWHAIDWIWCPRKASLT